EKYKVPASNLKQGLFIQNCLSQKENTAANKKELRLLEGLRLRLIKLLSSDAVSNRSSGISVRFFMGLMFPESVKANTLPSPLEGSVVMALPPSLKTLKYSNLAPKENFSEVLP